MGGKGESRKTRGAGKSREASGDRRGRNMGGHDDDGTGSRTGPEEVEALKLKLELAKLEAEENERQRRENQREHERKMELLEARRQMAELNVEDEGNADGGNGPSTSEMAEQKMTAHWQSILQSLAPNCDDPHVDLMAFFKIIEELFRRYSIPAKFQSHLVIPLLKSRGGSLLVNLSSEELSNYNKVKETVLEENQLSAAEQRRRYVNARRTGKETYIQFAGRLRTLFRYYLDTMGAKTIEQIMQLVLIDQFKDTLSTEARQYVELQCGTAVKTLEEVASLTDVYYSAQQNAQPRGGLGPARNARWGGARGDARTGPGAGGEKSEHTSSGEITRDPRAPRCFGCKKRGHVLRECPERNKNRNVARTQQLSVDRVLDGIGPRARDGRQASEQMTARVGLGCLGDAVSEDAPTRGNKPASAKQQLQHVQVRTREGKTVHRIIDSGCEITVLNSKLLDMASVERRGPILLRPALGPPRRAEQVEVELELALEERPGNSVRPLVTIVAAVSAELNGDLLLTPADYDLLRQQAASYNLVAEKRSAVNAGDNERAREQRGEVPDEVEAGLNGDDDALAAVQLLFRSDENAVDVRAVVADSTTEADETARLSEAAKLKLEQESCPTLKVAYRMIKTGKGGYVTIDGILYHLDRIQGQRVTQLVLPRKRRDVVLKMAHEGSCGGHLGIRKTSERIRYSFFWPDGVRKDVTDFVNSCADCQRRQVVKVSDRTPIEAVQRPELPFQVVNVDLIGPFDATKSRNKYVLCLVDQHTHWVEAIPLRSLTAKNTCEALLSIFMRTGVPQTIATDQGTNFTSDMTTEFEQMIGASPRFSTPGRPEANGLVERFNRVMKNMLHHAIRDHPRDWDRQLPFLTWAYNEVGCATTGYSPFRLLYGREPRGPLAILKETWDGSIGHPRTCIEPVHEYVKSIKARMEEAARQAGLISSDNQKRYVDYYNKRSRLREYQVGDRVLALIPDSSRKLLSRWTGPVEVLERHHPHTYVIAMPNGGRKKIHADKLRPFISRTNAVGIIYDDDSDMGEVYPPPMIADFESISSPLRLPEGKVAHLGPEEAGELESVLSRFPELLTGNLRRITVGQHRIRLKPGAEFRKPHLYRIPEALRESVDQQISELLDRGLIRPSESEFTHPVVCAKKKDGSIRLCVDYRALNAISESDQFPMERVTDLLYEIGKASFVTVLDLQKAYWQVGLDPASQDLTGFATHRGLYSWTVLPFGLKGAPATFQRIINNVLTPHQQYARAYLDDIAIFSNSWGEHLQHLEAVLRTLDEHKFAVNLGKSEVAKNEVSYLGHVVGSGTHRPDPSKLTAISGIRPPRTKKELRSFLGLCGYYREYIDRYAEIALPLTNLTKKRVPSNIPWDDAAQKSFTGLKDALANSPVLHTPDMSHLFTIYCDASDYAVSGCLSQQAPDGTYRPIAFHSAKLTPTQQKWSASEKEAFAVISSLNKFEPWVFGTKITVVTDHNPLTFLTSSLPKSPRLQRWSLAIQRFSLDIKYRKGSDNVNADALSRLPNSSWEEVGDTGTGNTQSGVHGLATTTPIGDTVKSRE